LEWQAYRDLFVEVILVRIAVTHDSSLMEKTGTTPVVCLLSGLELGSSTEKQLEVTLEGNGSS
jgi:hypothetical protein